MRNVYKNFVVGSYHIFNWMHGQCLQLPEHIGVLQGSSALQRLGALPKQELWSGDWDSKSQEMMVPLVHAIA